MALNAAGVTAANLTLDARKARSRSPYLASTGTERARALTLHQLAAVSLALSTGACLPVDTRPEPAKVVVDVELASDLQPGPDATRSITFSTQDGWNITLERMLVSMGELFLGGKHCNAYSDAFYSRILDLSQPSPQRLGQVWGLNDCRLGYSVESPYGNEVLGLGVTEEDRDFMGNAIVPVSSEKGLAAAEGMAIYVRGYAVKDTVSVSFDWGFSDRIDFSDCRRRVDSNLEELPLTGGDTTGLTLTVDPRRLFLFGAATEADSDIAETPLMQFIADADQVLGNANGRVAVDELIRAPFSSGLAPNIAEVLRRWTYPSVFLYGDGGECIRDHRGR